MTAFISIALCGICAKADTIVLKDATTMTVYNVEVAGKWVLYTETDDAEAPLRRIAADKVFAVKGADGQLQALTDNTQSAGSKAEPTSEATPGAQVQVGKEAVPSADNAALIEQYNNASIRLKKPKGEKDKEKYCTDFVALWGVTSGSVLSDDKLEVTFEIVVPQGTSKRIIPQYKTKITNKTAANIYIDLGSSYKIGPDGTGRPLYNNAVYTEGSGSGHGASLNLGSVAGALGVGGPIGTLASGIGIGGGTTRSTSVTTSEQRILTVPPHAAVYLPPMKYADGSKLREDYESLYFRTYPISDNMLSADADYRKYDSTKGFAHQVDIEGPDNAAYTRDVIKAPRGWLREIDEKESPKVIKRIITYSQFPDFREYTTLSFGLYMRAVMGGSPQWNVPLDFDLSAFEFNDVRYLLFGVGSVKK